MQKLLNNIFFILIMNSCTQAQNSEIDGIFIDDLAFDNVSIVETVDTLDDKAYYRYINMKSTTTLFGKPDKIVSRLDELMETTIVRLIYGKSYLEFYDHTYNGEIPKEDFRLLSFQFLDQKLSVEYQGETIEVGGNILEKFNLDQNKEQYILSLKRKILNERSDYGLRIKTHNGEIIEIGATFD